MQNLKKIQLGLLYHYQSPIPFDVYLERAPGKYTKLYHKNSDYICTQLERLIDRNIESLYIDLSDIGEFATFLNLYLNEIILGSKTLSPEEFCEIINCSVDITFDSFCEKSDMFLEHKNFVLMQAQSCVKAISKDTMSAIALLKALSQSDFLLQHSMQVMIFSTILAKISNLENNKTLQYVGIGALLHDIGQSRIDQSLFEKIHLTPSEWDIIRDHPHHGLKIIDQILNIPNEVRHIIMQHHEQFNGRGYPNRLSNKGIYPLAHLVSVADGFCSFLFKTNYRDTTYTPLQSIELMRSDLGHYDPNYLDLIENFFSKSKKKIKAA